MATGGQTRRSWLKDLEPLLSSKRDDITTMFLFVTARSGSDRGGSSVEIAIVTVVGAAVVPMGVAIV